MFQINHISLKRVGLVDKSGQVNILLGLGGDAFIGLHLEVAVLSQTGACGDELTDDDVLLQADQVVKRGEDGEGIEKGCKTLSVTCGDSSPKGRAKGLHPLHSMLALEVERICIDTLH